MVPKNEMLSNRSTHSDRLTDIFSVVDAVNFNIFLVPEVVVLASGVLPFLVAVRFLLVRFLLGALLGGAN